MLLFFNDNPSVTLSYSSPWVLTWLHAMWLLSALGFQLVSELKPTGPSPAFWVPGCRSHTKTPVLSLVPQKNPDRWVLIFSPLQRRKLWPRGKSLHTAQTTCLPSLTATMWAWHVLPSTGCCSCRLDLLLLERIWRSILEKLHHKNLSTVIFRCQDRAGAGAS